MLAVPKNSRELGLAPSNHSLAAAQAPFLLMAHLAFPHQQERQTAVSLHVPAPGMPRWSRCENPSEGSPSRLWSL